MKELIFGLIGGTALLMYGVDMMGEGLEKASGDMMKKMLSILTGNVFSAFLVGTFLTALVQSSTAVTVLTVGFVNAGLMKLPQAIGIIYGANIGTTITAQLMAFSFSFKLTEIALPVLGIGFAISIFTRNKVLQSTGEAIMGFGLMFLGLSILNSGIPYMKESETLRYFFETYASNPFLGIILGIVATALVHSSAATVGLVMVLGQAGLLDLQAAICIMLGDNIGTCITAQLASMNANINARRTAWGHTLYNVIGVSIVALILPYFVSFIEWATAILQPNAGLDAQIANSHTLFNTIAAIIFLPINKYYVKFLETVIRGKDVIHYSNAIYLDKLLLDTPAAAVKATISELIRGTEITKEMVSKTMESLFDNDVKLLDKVHKDEEIVNQLQKDITLYMVELSKRPLSDKSSVMVPAMINAINNIERIGDHTEDISRLIISKLDKKLVFSDSATDELKQLSAVIDEMHNRLIQLLKGESKDEIFRIVEMEEKVDKLHSEFSANHMKRLEDGKCNIEAGVIYLDIVSNFERIADRIYKIAFVVSEL